MRVGNPGLRDTSLPRPLPRQAYSQYKPPVRRPAVSSHPCRRQGCLQACIVARSAGMPAGCGLAFWCPCREDDVAICGAIGSSHWQETNSSWGRNRARKMSVLVGPNNSWSSQTPRDVRDYIVSGSTGGLTIVNDIDLNLPDETEALRRLSVLPHNNPNQSRIIGVANDIQHSHEFGAEDTWIKTPFANVSTGGPAE